MFEVRQTRVVPDHLVPDSFFISELCQCRNQTAFIYSSLETDFFIFISASNLALPDLCSSLCYIME